MYRVVLVDDEKRILDGLVKVVDWDSYNCVVCGTAEDTITGTELIRRERPDILITDIRMSGEDGLSMLAGLRSEFPDMQVTVLTGYRDFEYAQRAIQLGVTRFLLKPSKMDEINNALKAMTEKLDKEGVRASADDNAAGNFIVTQAINYMRRHFAEKLTLQNVADSCYVSQWHLSKLLNRHMNRSFYDLLNEFRIEEAKRLLDDPRLKVGDISLMVGYIDNAHFARTFKKLTGVSANEYRNSH